MLTTDTLAGETWAKNVILISRTGEESCSVQTANDEVTALGVATQLAMAKHDIQIASKLESWPTMIARHSANVLPNRLFNGRP